MLIDYLPYLGEGILVTIQVTVLAILVVIPCAFILGIARQSKLSILRIPAAFVVEVTRGSSAVVLLFLAYFVLPEFGIYLPAVATAVVVIGFSEACLASEIVRGAIQAIPQAQRDAVVVLGFKTWTRMTRIILPQAIPAMIPPFSNIFIDTLKFSSLAALVTVPDLTFRALQVRNALGESISVFLFLLVVYFILALILAWGMSRVEERFPAWSGIRKVKIPRPAAIGLGGK